MVYALADLGAHLLRERDRCPYRKFKRERTGDAVRPRSAPEARGRLPAPPAPAVRPCAVIGACGPHYSISDTNEAHAGDAARQI